MNDPEAQFVLIPEPARLFGDEQILVDGRWCVAATLPQYDANRKYVWRRPKATAATTDAAVNSRSVLRLTDFPEE